MKKKKWVRYNGGIISSSPCTRPNKLKIGKAYQVEEELDGHYTMLYRLVGIPGEFNYVWFDTIEVNYKPTYVATSFQIPSEGMCLECTRLSFSEKGRVSYQEIKTSPIMVVYPIAEQTYRAETINSIYIVHCL